MTTIKLTKNELRTQQIRLGQLEKYLPTLQLKKAMLQTEVMLAISEAQKVEEAHKQLEHEIRGFSKLFGEKGVEELLATFAVEGVNTKFESIAGVEIPLFEGVNFTGKSYGLFETPIWFDKASEMMKRWIALREEAKVAREKVARLEAELREVSIRVNLFEKVMIPRTMANIKKIKVFLGDQQLAAVAQAKMAKMKMEKKKAMA